MKDIEDFYDFVGRSFEIWVIVFEEMGFVMKEKLRIFEKWIVVMIGIIMLGMGMKIQGKDFDEVEKRKFDVEIGVMEKLIIMKIIEVIMKRIIKMQKEVEEGVIIVG